MIRAFFVSGLLTGVGLLIYAGLIEPRQLHIRDVEVGEGDRSVRIALMTDLHIGGLHVPPERVAKIVAQIIGVRGTSRFGLQATVTRAHRSGGPHPRGAMDSSSSLCVGLCGLRAIDLCGGTFLPQS